MKIDAGEAMIMAMLECYEASMMAWRILSKIGDAFTTVDEDDATEAMKILANPAVGDTPIVAGESGAVGLAGLVRVAKDRKMRNALGLGSNARVLLINTEGATDPGQYEKLIGLSPDEVSGRAQAPFAAT